MFLGDEIRRLRVAKDMSQEELASLAGTSTRTISRIELHEVTPHDSTLRAIAVALGVMPDFFWDYIEVLPKPRVRIKERVFV